jgi:SagB-type dehydrogenase family enzyme
VKEAGLAGAHETEMPFLIATIVADSLSIEISTTHGKITIHASTLDESRLVLAMLSKMDGNHSLYDIVAEADLEEDSFTKILSALSEIGAVEDSSKLWSWWAAISANPPLFRPRLTPDEAYSLPIWSPWTSNDYDAQQPSCFNDYGGATRVRGRSLDLSSATVHDVPGHESKTGSLAARVMCPQPDGHLAFSSAGAMWPIFLWVITQQSAELSKVHFVDHWKRRILHYRTVSNQSLLNCFVEDDALSHAIQSGSSIIFVTAQLNRICGKYGNRGWMYALIEAGQVIAHIELNAPALNLGTRVIGGFYEELVERDLLSGDILPVACVVVADEQR